MMLNLCLHLYQKCEHFLVCFCTDLQYICVCMACVNVPVPFELMQSNGYLKLVFNKSLRAQDSVV